MKPSSPHQLARFLDQVAASYPNGIPVNVIVSPASQDDTVITAPLYQFYVVGERELSPGATNLLEGIASKGLRLARDEYSVSRVSEQHIQREVASLPSNRVIVFGASSDRGLVRRPGGEPALLTHSLEELSGNAELKKELWRDLQAFLPRS